MPKFTKKLIVSLSVIATLFTIVGGIWAFDVRYAKEKIVEVNMENLENKFAGALENQQYKSDVRYFQFMDDKLRNDIYELRKKLERDPENELLKQDYNDLKERREEIKKKIEESMQKIKVN